MSKYIYVEGEDKIAIEYASEFSSNFKNKKVKLISNGDILTKF